jgi:hypothetical protein
MSTVAVVLLCALNVLGRSAETFPPIHVVERPADRSSIVEAFVDRDNHTINLIADSPAFAAARQRADREPRCTFRPEYALVASILVHEEWHLRYGPDEDGAYSAQQIALLSLGIPMDSRLFRRVMLSKSAATAAQRARIAP